LIEEHVARIDKVSKGDAYNVRCIQGVRG